MIKEVRPTDRIKDSRVLVNDNFKELDERLKKVERKLQVKKSK